MFCLIRFSCAKKGDNHPNPYKTPTLPSENLHHAQPLLLSLLCTAAKQKTMPDKVHSPSQRERCCTATRSLAIRFWGILHDPSLPREPDRYGAVRREMGTFRGISARLLSHTEICPKVLAKKKKKVIKTTGCDLCCKRTAGSIISQSVIKKVEFQPYKIVLKHHET